jgi:RHS repeat-associated protein
MRISNYTFTYPKNYLNSKPVKGLQGCGLGYRFTFNGQEKDDEVSGSRNTMTATFWEYDSRLGRRWNVDPKTLPYLSTYSCFSNNPTLYVDPKGDIFKLGKDKDGKVSEKSKTDVKSLSENKDNQKYITFDNDGKVGLDFGDMRNEEKDKLLAGDIGLNLINKLATATGKDANGNVKDLVFVYVLA